MKFNTGYQFRNIEGNELSGIIPAELIERSNSRSLTLRYVSYKGELILGLCYDL